MYFKAWLFGLLAFAGYQRGVAQETSTPSTYIVIAPQIIRPGLPYSIYVNILKSDETFHKVRAEIKSSGDVVIGEKSVENVKIGDPYTVTIDGILPEKFLPEQQYKLRVRAETANQKMIFEKERDLTYERKSQSIFVQTDKAVYKPGTTVRYRVIVVKPNLLPAADKVTVKILDPNRNIIVQKQDEQLTKGVFEGELQLAAEPPLGDWKIRVHTGDKSDFEKTFAVEKYVLPKFEVTVTSPSFITRKDSLTVAVKAKYTYGKPVSGKATVAFHMEANGRNRHFNGEPMVPDLSEKTVKLDEKGEAFVEFTNDELKGTIIRTLSGSKINVSVRVTEELTDIQRNATAQVLVYDKDLKVGIIKLGETYKPGLPYSVLIALKRMDGTPAPATAPRRIQVQAGQGRTWRRASWLPAEIIRNVREEKVIELDSHGTALYNINTSADRLESLTISARYDEKGADNFESTEIKATVSISPSLSPSANFIQLIPNQDGPIEVGKTISFNVKSTETLKALSAQVISRNSIVLSQEVKGNGDSATVSFTATAEMAPTSRLVVYTIRTPNQEILADIADLKIEGLFKNKVSISMDRAQAQPGDSVKVTVKADPASFVGLLGVDQSVLLLKSGNDITTEMVESDVEDYITKASGRTRTRGGLILNLLERSNSLLGYCRRCRPIRRVTGETASDLFRNAGLIVITDALLYEKPKRRIYYHAWDLGYSKQVGSAPTTFRRKYARKPSSVVEKVLDKVLADKTAEVKIRTKFPEVWIWSSMETNAVNGEAVLNTSAPDTITSWVASAFAINSQTGLGIAPTTAKLTIFRPFFITLNLPYSVKQGEKFALQVLVFNYMEAQEDVTVTLQHDENSGFDFIQADGSRKTASRISYGLRDNSRTITVPGGGSSRAVYFPILPTKIGNILLSVSATSSQAADAVEQPLKVEPEGYRVDRNVPFVVDLTGGNEPSEFSQKVILEFPSDVVQGSKLARFDLTGDLMGPVLSNLESLIRMPYGCGEQNMIKFVPNIVVLNYLKALGKAEAEIKAKAVKHMETGYQRQLQYKHPDGSFSAFGKSDRKGSTWLTAFVARSFKQAKEFIFVDDQILQSSLHFLQSTQKADGSFVEHGSLFDKTIQGGAQNGGVSLTAYILIALLENGVKNEKAQQYLEQRLEDLKTDTYGISVVTYALHLAESSKKAAALAMLEALKIETSGVHWSEKRETEKKKGANEYFYQPRPVDVEITAYALLTYIHLNAIDKAIPIAKWLSGQRNSLGGWSSTQDTILALQALGAFAEKVHSPGLDVSVALKNGADHHQFKVAPENAMILQSYEITNMDEPVEVVFTGKGMVFSQVQYSYHRVEHKDKTPFFCTQDVQELNGAKRLKLELCCNYTKAGLKSNMAVAEIDALSGYQFDNDNIAKLTKIEGLQRAELEKDMTKINLYFNALSNEPVCMSLFSDMLYQVTDQKPAQFKLYDYYDPELQMKSSYSRNSTRTLNDFCPQCWPTDGVHS